MKTFEVEARMLTVTHLSLDIEAESAEEAFEIAKEKDGAEFAAGHIEEDWIWGETREKEVNKDDFLKAFDCLVHTAQESTGLENVYGENGESYSWNQIYRIRNRLKYVLEEFAKCDACGEQMETGLIDDCGTCFRCLYIKKGRKGMSQMQLERWEAATRSSLEVEGIHFVDAANTQELAHKEEEA